jgi:choline dehydrogenase-like flavoprotein
MCEYQPPQWIGTPMSSLVSQRHVVQITVSLLISDAYVNVTLNSSALPFAVPAFSLNNASDSYLTNRDVTVLSWGVEQVRRIVQFSPLQCEPGDELYPGPSVISEALDNWISTSVRTGQQWSGTAKLGNGVGLSSDATSVSDSVLDPSLRVRGTSNLYVADTSIIPYTSSGNVGTFSAAIAYRAADMISMYQTAADS